MDPVTITPLDHTRTRDVFVPWRVALAEQCIENHRAPTWPAARFTVGVADQGPLCLDCTPLRAPAHVIHVIGLMNEASEALEEAPIGWQRDVADLLIASLRAVYQDLGLAP